MRRLLVLVLLAGMALTMRVGAASAAAPPRIQARPALVYENPLCDPANGATPNRQLHGLSVFTLTPKGRLGVTLMLVGAEPNTTYDVHVHQYPPGCPPSDMFVDALTTNRRGNGTVRVAVTKQPGAFSFWVCAMHHMDMTGGTDSGMDCALGMCALGMMGDMGGSGDMGMMGGCFASTAVRF